VDRQAALDRARAGSTEALGELLGNLRPYVRLLVRTQRRGQLPARLDDSDLIQDALLEAHRSFAAFEGRTVEYRPLPGRRPAAQGGMGTVWKARDTQLQRDLAVKVPHFDGPPPARAATFSRAGRPS
jgi:hypothetical protein